MRVVVFSVLSAVMAMVLLGTASVHANVPIDPLVIDQGDPGSGHYTITLLYSPIGNQGLAWDESGPYSFVQQHHLAQVSIGARLRITPRLDASAALNLEWHAKRFQRTCLGECGPIVSHGTDSNGSIALHWRVAPRIQLDPEVSIRYARPTGTWALGLSSSYVRDPMVVSGSIEYQADIDSSAIRLGLGTAFVANDRLSLGGMASLTLPATQDGLSSTAIGTSITYDIVANRDHSIVWRSLFSMTGGRVTPQFSVELISAFGS